MKVFLLLLLSIGVSAQTAAPAITPTDQQVLTAAYKNWQDAVRDMEVARLKFMLADQTIKARNGVNPDKWRSDIVGNQFVYVPVEDKNAKAAPNNSPAPAVKP